ncbi:site-specific integrase [Dyadobacter sp. CY347]|uniref:tyrosine-type recombinase/integrase n=1 Tax=Dyadobacter sp. CY347 TaxID=2909336 RepID=UPI001F3B6A69|nr:site-specific integrase [Dyadobacter sp. CY347]MCF2490743.1 site-specific integrase [Dyadobacter sp. CY347]
MGAITVNLFLDKRTSNEGAGIVKWLVSFEGKQRLFTTGIKVQDEDWTFLKKHKNGIPGQVKNDYRRKLWNMFYGNYFEDDQTGKEVESYLSRAKTIISKLQSDFSFELFAHEISIYGQDRKILENRKDDNNVVAALKSKAESMTQQGRIGNATSYLSAAASLSRFVSSLTIEQRYEYLNYIAPKGKAVAAEDLVIKFEHLTPQMLALYERWMLKYGKAAKSEKGKAVAASLTTVGIYGRHIRSVFNDAIEKGIVNRDLYPFSKNRYTIPAGSNTKKALTKGEVLRIMEYQCAPGLEQRSRDLWVFSYLCNGMNVNDICRLKWEDIQSDKLTFVRQKTARSRKSNQTRIKVTLFPETLAIIERWAGKDRHAKKHIFPFLENDMPVLRERIIISQVIKITNQYMRGIAKELEIESDVNTYSARHSFATILLQSEAPLAFISQSLGHTSISTTESYLGSFDDEKTKKYLSALL